MEKSEPALVPQWLKTANGGVASTGTLHNVGSSLYADKSSSYRRSVSSNGLGIERDIYAQSRHYSNFGWNNRNRDQRKDGGYHENERPLKLDNGYHDYINSHKADRLERSSSWQSKYVIKSRETNTRINIQGNKSNGGSPTRILGGSSGIHKSSFEKDFPSLVGEERQGDITRISSPRFNSAAHVGSSIISSEGWTSALVDIPPAVGGSLLTSTSVLHVPPNVNTVLNMAETLAKAPLRPQSAPQLVDETQRLEELAIKQSKQLIPVMPSTLKPLATSLGEKLKPKARTGELGATLKATTHPSPLPVNHLRGIAKFDSSKPLQGGTFHILNREKNGLSSPVRAVLSFNTCKSAGVLCSAPSAPTTTKNPSNQKLKTDKASNSSVVPNALAEKKAALQAKDRNDFFNSLRKKTSASNSPSNVELSSTSSTASEKHGKQESLVDSAPAYPDDHSLLSDTTLNLQLTVDNGDADAPGFEKGERDAADVFDLTEEERRFLKSLGWDENMGGKPLTAEEINAFLTKYNLISSPKCQNDESLQ